MDSGLSDDQLVKVFNILEVTPDSKAIYEKWMETIAPQLIHPTIKSYTGVNLYNPHQRDNVLFRLLRFNMHVIDFWLSKVVFPKEMQIFKDKLTCTAWDLCSDRFEHLVTGFSGTNDTKNTLPLPIAQNDLPELENTNENMRQVLLREENRSYKRLPANFDEMEILEQLKKDEIPVLLDAGALIKLDNNAQVAKEWLKLVPKKLFDAAVYFDPLDNLQTIEQNGVVVAYDSSVYRDNLSRCLVYLDDVHTRGTDLKFPLDWKACVTLSGDITRDKTVQSCMRMRQLGKTHSISFLASFEADMRIRKLCKLSAEDKVTNENVIEFICENSRRFERENMSHWATAGLNYTKKLIGHELFEKLPNKNSTNDLYDWCIENEYHRLAEMYGEKKEALLQDIIESKMDKLATDSQMTDETRRFVNEVKSKMIQKLEDQAPDLKKFTHSLDEEQEKELEKEQAEAREVPRPGKSQAAVPSFDNDLVELVSRGIRDDLIESMKTDGALMTIANSLSHTKLYQSIKNDLNAWADHLLVTRDFQTVIVSASDDQFLRPIWWIAKINNAKDGDESFIFLLSSYECNRLKTAFQKSTKATLMMYRPRLSKLHSNLLEISALHITGMTEIDCKLDIDDEIQIGIYSGMMYFHREAELKAYCQFLGLILRPRTEEQERAFKEKIIEPKGFVPLENRQYSEAISECVGQCRFQNNPMKFIIELIEANHQSLPKVSHVASILLRGIKPDLGEKGMRNSEFFFMGFNFY